MRHFFLFALLLFGLVACATTSEVDKADATPAVDEQAPAQVDLSFNWPIPSSAWVIEDVLKNGTRSRLKYRLDIEPVEGFLHVHHREFSFLLLDGKPLENEAEKKAVDAMLKQVQASMPVLIATSEGDFVGITGIEAIIDLVLEMKDYGSARRESIEAAVRSPRAKAMLTQKVGGLWRSWAELWTGLHLKEGEPQTTVTSAGKGTYRLLHVDDEKVKVEFRLEFNEAQLIAQTRAMMGEMMRRMGKDPAEMEVALANAKASMTTVTQAELDRATLRPLVVDKEARLLVKVGSEPAKERLETRHYEFDWLPVEAQGQAVGN